MTPAPRRKFNADSKAKVAIKEHQTTEEICKKFEVHPTVQLMEKRIFSKCFSIVDTENMHFEHEDQEKKLQELYAQIGQLKVENDLKKIEVIPVCKYYSN